MKRERFSPAVGDEYINQGNGSIFRCIEWDFSTGGRFA